PQQALRQLEKETTQRIQAEATRRCYQHQMLDTIWMGQRIFGGQRTAKRVTDKNKTLCHMRPLQQNLQVMNNFSQRVAPGRLIGPTVAAQVRGNHPVGKGKMLKLITALQGLTAKTVNKNQCFLGRLGS